MKNILKKNQIIITALVIMIAVAGYLSLTQKEQANLVDTQSNEVMNSQDVGATTGSPIKKGADASKTNNESTDISADDIGNDGKPVADSGEVAASDGKNVGEAVLVTNTIGSNYFESAKLSREQTRAKNKEILMELVNNANTSKQQKENAISQIIAMTGVAEKENATETLLEAKGFEDVVVRMVDKGVDVIVNANNLTDQQIAQIEDITKRKTEVSPDNIVITPVGVKEQANAAAATAAPAPTKKK